MRNTAKGIAAEIAKGAFRPHTALTNMALAYYQNPANYFAKSLLITIFLTRTISLEIAGRESRHTARSLRR